MTIDNSNHDSLDRESADRFVREVMRYLDGLASPEEFERLQAQLNASADHRRLFVRLCLQARAMAEGLGAREMVGSELTDESLSDEDTPDVFLEVIEAAIHTRELHDIEDLANRQLAENLRQQQEEARRARRIPEAEPLGPRVVVIPSAVAYVGTGLIAALLMLTVYLIAAPDPPGADPGSTASQTGPGSAPPGTPRFVANLTAVSEDAVWADQSEGWVVGMPLEAGEINLSEGSIAVRLLDGAEVTLYAPVRFTLLDTNHSELQHGQLSAFVPDSGHGFEVIIPGGVVTDFGTSFQLTVPVSSDDTPSHIEVSQGMVTVTPRRAGRRGDAVPIRSDQFATLSQDGGEVRAYAYTNQTAGFETPSTGRHLRHGQVDPAWTVRKRSESEATPAVVIAPDDWTLPEYLALDWDHGDPRTSQWLSFRENAYQDELRQTTYYYSTTVVVPENFEAGSAELALKIMVDNQVTGIRVNGRSVSGRIDLPYPQLGRDNPAQYHAWSELTLTDCFVSGENTIEFEILNDNGGTGLRVEMQGSGLQLYTELSDRP